METKFNFNSQVCTSRSQSERLLALGLKKETADCYYYTYDKNTYELNEVWEGMWEEKSTRRIPAWSLHRLIVLCKYNDNLGTIVPREKAYDYMIESIEFRIKEGYFNKEYLV